MPIHLNRPQGLRFFESMESNITDQQFWSSDSQLAQPHFVDEATLLSARPVVPIEKIPVKPGFSRPWVLGLALAGAVFLGVAATAFYVSQFRTAGAQPESSLDLPSGAQGVTSKPNANEPVTKTTDATNVGSRVDADTSARVKAQVPDSLTTRPLNSSDTVSTKPALRRVTVAAGRSSESEHETREEQRAAKREAKERKRANRERREGKHSDEVLRIRDIFEGSSRP